MAGAEKVEERSRRGVTGEEAVKWIMRGDAAQSSSSSLQRILGDAVGDSGEQMRRKRDQQRQKDHRQRDRDRLACSNSATAKFHREHYDVRASTDLST